MRDRMERFVLLPFTAGCISESSIAVGLQQDKRSKLDSNSTPTRTREGEKEEEEEEHEEDEEESLSGENLKNPLSLLALPRFQKIGLDGCASSILSKGWNNEPDMINPPLELAMAKRADKPSFRSLLETK